MDADVEEASLGALDDAEELDGVPELA